MKNTDIISNNIFRRRVTGIGAILVALAALSTGVAAHAQSGNDDSQIQKENDSATSTNGADNSSVSNESGMTEHNTALDKLVKAKLSYCQQHYHSCKQATKNVAGILVFPSVVKADLIVGGAGGKGALIENGRITGYYSIGAGSVGLQAGYQSASQIYVFPTEASLKALKNGSEWHVGDSVGVTVMAADANVRNSSGKVEAFIFDANGIEADAAVDIFDIWKTGTERPKSKS